MACYFPQQAPLGDDVDFASLARDIKLAGGNIKNIVLAAAFYAASDDGVIGMAHLLEGTRRSIKSWLALGQRRIEEAGRLRFVITACASLCHQEQQCDRRQTLRQRKKQTRASKRSKSNCLRLKSRRARTGIRRCFGFSARGNRYVQRLLKKGTLRRSAALDEDLESVPPAVQETFNSSGRPLDSSTRQFMESRFGEDFGQVQVHTDGKAAQSADAVNARAYTVGSDIVFAEGQYSPGTNEGNKVIAHELAHVSQQAARGAMFRA